MVISRKRKNENNLFKKQTDPNGGVHLESELNL